MSDVVPAFAVDLQETRTRTLIDITRDCVELKQQQFEDALAPYLDSSVAEGSPQHTGVLVCLKTLYFDVIYRVGGIETINQMRSDYLYHVSEVLGPNIIIGQLENNLIAIMVPDMDIPQIEACFDKLKARCKQICSSCIDGDIQLSYAAGFTVVNGITWDCSELISEAIRACNIAVELGPYHIHTYEPCESEDANFQRVALWIPRLQQAVDGQTMSLHQQEIVPVQTASTLPPLREFLVRVPDDAGRPIDAASFIDIAEKYRFIGHIDRWVVGKAISLLIRGVGSDRRSFINLSAYSLQDPGFLTYVNDLFSDSEVDGTLLGFEVTECSMIRDVEAAAMFLRTMKDRGCLIALDDFGTGYSSLQHLKRLPVDMIKLDGEFVRGLPDDSISMAIMEAAVSFAKATEKLVVAEYIENRSILDTIRELGIDYGQGYELAKPIAVPETLEAVNP